MTFSGPVWKELHPWTEVASFEISKSTYVDQKHSHASGKGTSGAILMKEISLWGGLGLNSVQENLITEMSKNLIRRQSYLHDPLTWASRIMHGDVPRYLSQGRRKGLSGNIA